VIDVAQPTQLDPTEQDTLVKQIGLALLRVAPSDWEQIVVTYRAIGRYHEVIGEVTTEDEVTESWSPPPDIVALFGRLRSGMYREGRGTWFNTIYQLDRPSSYNLEYDRDEPDWDQVPPSQAFADELRLFPRDEENIPDWLRRRLSAPPPPPPPPPPGKDRPRFRMARIFDGMGPAGRPVVNRPQLDDLDHDAVLDYLDDAPVVMPGRGYDVDRLDPEGRSAVPIAFHSDGTWVWPAAVNYYLRTYGVSPEPDLVEHIRRNDFAVPEIDETTLAAAGASLNRGGPPPPGGRPGPPPGPTQSLPKPPPPPPPPPPPKQAPPPPPAAPAPPVAAGMPPPGPALGQLRAKLAEFGVPESTYRIGPPVERAWILERVEDGWRVGWFEREQFVAPALFEDVADASAFLLGKVLLDNAPRPEVAAAPPKPEPPPERRPPSRTVSVPRAAFDDMEEDSSPSLSAPVDGRRQGAEHRAALATAKMAPSNMAPSNVEVAVDTGAQPIPRAERTSHRRSGGDRDGERPNSKSTQDWPIQPLYGEPPLTLFRGKRMVELPDGTEIDRFGDPDGNLTYVIGTPFESRSLVPEWVNKEYHSYRVQRPLEVLTGTAIPWFEQPGGGTAYLLPHAVEDLLEDGYLVEIDGDRPPISAD
jgi:hypothetical protein